MRRIVPPAVVLASVIGVSQLLTSRPAHTEPQPAPRADTGCSVLVDQLCNEVFLPPARGALAVDDPLHPVKISLGVEANGFERHETRELELRLAALAKFPPDFVKTLKRLRYEGQLRAFLNYSDISRLSEGERLKFWDLSRETQAKWDHAFTETVFKRMVRLHPEIARIPTRLRSSESEAEENCLSRELRAEISRIIWSDSPEWRRLVALFEEIRMDTISVVRDAGTIQAEEKPDLIAALSQAKVLPPFSSLESLDHPCDPMGNSRYDAATNRIWICPENLTSHDPAWTIAHELGHAIGTMRVSQRIRRESRIGQSMLRMTRQLCSKEPVDCAEWASLKAGFDAGLGTWHEARPWSRKLFSCLKSRLTQVPSMDKLRQLAEDSARWAFDDLAQHSTFLQLAKQETLSPGGDSTRNPAWANPCNLDSPDGTEFPEEPFESGRPAILFFALETRCGQAGTSPKAFERALESTYDLLTRYALAQIRMEGEFSTLPAMNNNDYAEDVEEQASDALASEVLARRLARIPDLRLRRMNFIANVASLCEKPSLQSVYRREGEIENRWVRSESHSIGLKRIRETLRAPLRGILGCEKDFEQRDCPF